MELLSPLSLKAQRRARNIRRFYIRHYFIFAQLFRAAYRWTNLPRVGLLSHPQQCEEHVTLLGKFAIVKVDYLCIKYEIWHVMLTKLTIYVFNDLSLIMSIVIYFGSYCVLLSLNCVFLGFVNIHLIFVHKNSLHPDVYQDFGV